VGSAPTASAKLPISALATNQEYRNGNENVGSNPTGETNWRNNQSGDWQRLESVWFINLDGDRGLLSPQNGKDKFISG